MQFHINLNTGMRMKKYLLLLVTSLITMASLNANTEGLYIGGFGGANWAHFNKKHGVTSNFKTGYVAGGSVGYKFCFGTRFEVEGAYRHNKLDYLKFEGVKYRPSANANTTTVLVNVIQDFNFCQLCVTPYLGGGIGYANNKANASVDGVNSHKTSNSFAWQVIAGVSYPLFCSTELGLEYRFMQPHANVYDQSVDLALRYFF